MEQLWSMSTTIREASRIPGFIKTAIEMDGDVWDKENQEKFQILLIKNREYLNNPDNTQTFNKLSEEQCELLRDKQVEMTFEQAADIFYAKEYNDPAMRGRQSMKPLEKLGLVYRVNGRVVISSAGYKLANGEISVDDFMRDALLKMQFPNPYEDGFTGWETKPFINTLRLIRAVNSKCRERGMKEVGISKLEFGIFALSLDNYKKVNQVADELIRFRKHYNTLLTEQDRESYFSEYVKDYLKNFKQPEKNVKEYTDNMIRYLRLTNFIYIRGKYAHTYIDLEPRRMIEIESILEVDDGRPLSFDEAAWRNYMGEYGSYVLPYETVGKLTEIADYIYQENKTIEDELGLIEDIEVVPDTDEKTVLIDYISTQREKRTRLQNLELKRAYQEDYSKISEAVDALDGIRTKKKDMFINSYSIELEKWINVTLNIINDSILIKPNTVVGDDNEPIFTAPGGVPDIECFYDDFNLICEVTTLTSRDQWFNEGQPVMRHLRDFENNNLDKDSYCLFVAPRLHPDTLETFFTAVTYSYKGAKQKIIPMTISQIERILLIVKGLYEVGKPFSHRIIRTLYDSCIDLETISSSDEWPNMIDQKISTWESVIA